MVFIFIWLCLFRFKTPIRTLFRKYRLLIVLFKQRGAETHKNPEALMWIRRSARLSLNPIMLCRERERATRENPKSRAPPAFRQFSDFILIQMFHVSVSISTHLDLKSRCCSESQHSGCVRCRVRIALVSRRARPGLGAVMSGHFVAVFFVVTSIKL